MLSKGVCYMNTFLRFKELTLLNSAKPKPIIQLFFLLTVLLLLPGCKSLFEAVEDVKAREALEALAQVQEDYHKKNSTFARNLVQIQEAGMKLEYHTGLVYVEIEDASENSWRAVALPQNPQPQGSSLMTPTKAVSMKWMMRKFPVTCWAR